MSALRPPDHHRTGAPRGLRLTQLFATIALLAIAAGCGHSAGGTPQPSSTAQLPAANGPTLDVEIQDYRFAADGVEIEAGMAVRWTNRGNAPHTATADDGTFDTGQLGTAESASHVFATPGTYPYVCSLHTDMRGTITVVAAHAAAS